MAHELCVGPTRTVRQMARAGLLALNQFLNSPPSRRLHRQKGVGMSQNLPGPGSREGQDLPRYAPATAWSSSDPKA